MFDDIKHLMINKSFIVIVLNTLFYGLSVLTLNLFDFSFLSLLIAGLLFIFCQFLILFFLKTHLKSILSSLSNHKFTIAVIIMVTARTGMMLLHSFITIDSFGNYAVLISLLSFFFLYAISVFLFYCCSKELAFEKLFVIQAILFGVILLFIVPLYGVADEPQHMRTAYYVSNKMLGIETSYEGIYMRQDDSGFFFNYPEYSIDDLNAYLTDLSKPLNHSELVFVPNSGGTPQTIEFARRPFVFYEQQYQYFAAASGITIGRLLGMNTISVYLLGRVFNLCLFIVVIYISLRLLPYGKSLLYSISLFPMTLQLAASTSRDAFRISLAVLCVSLTIHLIYGENEYTKKQTTLLYICLFVLCSLLLPLRNYVYLTIAILPLFLLANKKGMMSNKFILISTCIVMIMSVGFILFKSFIFTQPIVEEPIKYLSWDPANGYSIEYFINHPIYLVTMIRTTILNRGVWYIDNMIGNPLGWLSISVPDIFMLCIKILLLINIFKRDYEESPTSFFRITSFEFSFISLLLVFVGMAITWTRNGIMEVEGVQGRYFTPLLLPLLLPFRGKLITVSKEVDKAVIPLLFLFTSVIIQYLMLYYI